MSSPIQLPPPLPTEQLITKHIKRAGKLLGRSRQQIWQDIQRALGRCVICAAPRTPKSKSFCQSCLDKNWHRQQRRNKPWYL